MTGVAVIDLFAGAGGLTVAAEMANCQTRLMVELDPNLLRHSPKESRRRTEFLRGTSNDFVAQPCARKLDSPSLSRFLSLAAHLVSRSRRPRTGPTLATILGIGEHGRQARH